MKAVAYRTPKHWYKGNTHIHTTRSDGGKTRAEAAALYAGAGYEFLFRTDHNVTSGWGRGAGRRPYSGSTAWSSTARTRRGPSTTWCAWAASTRSREPAKFPWASGSRR